MKIRKASKTKREHYTVTIDNKDYYRNEELEWNSNTTQWERRVTGLRGGLTWSPVNGLVCNDEITKQLEREFQLSIILENNI